MSKATRHSRGFTLITSLLLLMVMSGVAIGLLYMVNGAGHVGGNDMETNMAYYGAESGMEKLTTDLASLYNLKLSPTQTDLNTLASTSAPSGAQINSMTYLERATWAQVDANGNPITSTSVISSGANQGLMAEIVPVTLQVTATRPSGASVNMTRGVQVALIPVFQFGVFSDSDLSYFPGPEFKFKGRVHTNGNLFLAADSGPLYLGSKVTAVGEIMRDRLANNFNGNGGNYSGSVYVPNTIGGCDSAMPVVGGVRGPNCLDFGIDGNNATNDASWSGGIPPAGAANPNWAGGTNISTSTFNGMIGNATSIGVLPLQLPFVQGAAGNNTADQQIQILRPPKANEAPTTPLGASREYNKSTIRILLADTQAELHPDGSALDAVNDIQLEALQFVTSATGTAVGSKSYFAVADPVQSGDPSLVAPICNNGIPLASRNCAAAGKWPLVKGWLRVEYLDRNTSVWTGITPQWLGYGFTKSGMVPRTSPGVDTVGQSHPNSILIFQQLADRDGSGAVTNGATAKGTESNIVTGQNYNFYPINFYDPREGYYRDNPAGGTCYVNGFMNAVEIDVGNLKQWLAGTGVYGGGSGINVNYLNQNGYLLYFSDRRGMLPNPNSTPIAGVKDGVAGWEDVINTGTGGAPDRNLEAQTPGYNDNIGFSPEDVNENGQLDNWGAANMGDGFNINTNTNPPNPYRPVGCIFGGRQNWVAGARHVLRLVDGALNNLPVRPDNNQGGFTVVSENPVYVWGDYNSRTDAAANGDPFWANENAVDIPHSAAAIIADAVTLLSNQWSDLSGMQNPTNVGARPANATYYRMAIASGKNMNFPQPNGTGNDFGTDGGVHNFLRYIESWPDLYYRGSLISLYYSEYATGIFKCCGSVYSPPTRHYFFDTQFLVPTNLPPGTPLLQDINNLTYWQSFSPCTTQAGGSCTN